MHHGQGVEQHIETMCAPKQIIRGGSTIIDNRNVFSASIQVLIQISDGSRMQHCVFRMHLKDYRI